MAEERGLIEWVTIGVLGYIILNIIAVLLNSLFGLDIYLGPGLLLIAVAASVLLAFILAINLWKGSKLDKKDLLAMVFVFIITILALVFLRKLLPEIFQPAAQSLLSMINP